MTAGELANPMTYVPTDMAWSGEDVEYALDKTEWEVGFATRP